MSKTIERTPAEVTEIDRHKYFLSEKAGHDVGWEFAEQDWESNFAEEFRRGHQAHPSGGKGISFLFKRLFAR